MDTSGILTNVAILFVAATVWDDMRRGDRLANTGKTWLMVACIFAAISIILKALVS